MALVGAAALCAVAAGAMDALADGQTQTQLAWLAGGAGLVGWTMVLLTLTNRLSPRTGLIACGFAWGLGLIACCLCAAALMLEWRQTRKLNAVLPATTAIEAFGTAIFSLLVQLGFGYYLLLQLRSAV